MKKKIKTMEALSKEIGLSRPTLSKYFQNPGGVRKSTRSKIEQALALIDYVPNFYAVNMNRKQTRLLGAIIPHMNDLFYTSLMESIERRAIQDDYTVIIQSSHGSSLQEVKAIENLRSMNVDGVIIAPIGAESNINILDKLNADFPLVLVDSPLPDHVEGADFVGTDNNQSMRLMIDYLCRSGQEPIYFGMPRVNNNSIEREKAYRSHMQELGYRPKVISLIQAESSWDFEIIAYNTARKLFKERKYTASTILCANDRLAMGVIRAANEAGLFYVDGERTSFRVAGHDNHPLSQFLWPDLTTVSQNTVLIGTSAAELLISKISGERLGDEGGNKLLCDAQLILRSSA